MYQTYGFSKDMKKCIAVLIGCTEEKQVFEFCKKIATDPLFKPGITIVMVHIDASCILMDLREVVRVGKLIGKSNPKKLAILMSYDTELMSTMIQNIKILKLFSRSIKVFSDLNKLLEWVNTN